MLFRADKLPIPHNNVVGENTVLQLNILETTIHVCVLWERVGGTPHRHDTRKVIDFNCKNVTSQWDFFLCK